VNVRVVDAVRTSKDDESCSTQGAENDADDVGVAVFLAEGAGDATEVTKPAFGGEGGPVCGEERDQNGKKERKVEEGGGSAQKTAVRTEPTMKRIWCSAPMFETYCAK
jgi:hypothetical protein